MAYEYTRENNLHEDSCFLVTKITEKDEDGVENEVGFEEKEVFCLVGSIYQKEFYSALQAGITSQYRISIMECEYEGQKIVKYKDVYYTVYRRYPTGDYIELYLRDDIGTLNE